MVSRDDIFAIADEAEDVYGDWKDDILKFYSTDELKEFFEDFVRLRDGSINWKKQSIEFDE